MAELIDRSAPSVPRARRKRPSLIARIIRYFHDSRRASRDDDRQHHLRPAPEEKRYECYNAHVLMGGGLF